ncbi:hypothetical protein DFP72DRAFT_912565 [Ephemerocybe angulata]|uniref:AIG1-type G domain-containing protein n=1 Tax=Ephemerocybe angulata TaxID=980116 RepID=A0A8H6HNT7_9AGAR|nr:hypothetical protein DFP72DRAFT_912565 [Tulosesus angulatus]
MSPAPKSVAILIVGMTGSGKSRFTNDFLDKVGHKLEERVEVGHTLASQTQDVVAITVEDSEETDNYEHIRGHNLVIVDTPGFDDSDWSRPDMEIARKIVNWIAKSRESNIVIGGFIYLHDISLDRYNANAKKTQNILVNLCGKDELKRVVMVTSKWARELDIAGPELLHSRYDELRTQYWSSLLEQEGVSRAKMRRWNEAIQGETAFDIVHLILEVANDLMGQSKGELNSFLIQDELSMGMSFEKTQTGSALLKYFDPREWLESLRGFFSRLFGLQRTNIRCSEIPRG